MGALGFSSVLVLSLQGGDGRGRERGKGDGERGKERRGKEGKERERKHTAVESKSLGILLGYLLRGISRGILNARSLALLASVDGVEDVDEEGGDGG